MRYEAIPEFNESDVEKVFARDDLDKLRLVALSLALGSEDHGRAESICQGLANHEDRIVRGNAILGLGHIARIHRSLAEHSAKPAVEAALRDSDAWVRGQAEAAADDIEHFLKWKLKRL